MQEALKNYSVIYIITKLELGGAQKVCLSLAENIPTKNISCILVSGGQGSLVGRARVLEKFFELSTLQREIGLGSLWRELIAFLNLIRLIGTLKREHGPIIVHTHSTKAGILGRWAAWFAGADIIVHTIHGYGFHKHQRWLTKLLVIGIEHMTSFITDHFICVSRSDAYEGKRRFPGFAQKYSLIRAAVSFTNFIACRPVRSLDNSFIYGTIACFKPQKNIIDSLRAFKEVYQKNPSARLEIIGDGKLRPIIESWIASEKLEYVITLYGWQEHVAPIMARWHVFILSSLWEGLPCAIVEARLLKLPIVCYDTGGVREIVKHGLNGFVYQQKAWQMLAQGMYLLSRNKALYKRFAMYKDKLHEFELEVMVQRHRHLYASILRKASNTQS
ncbi:MAG TPA: glycosyltransferase [Candidatus Babeliaceae bacterium]|nr:glycosyltransferase [Candidatus Babeliaceae bacterium]